MKWYILFLIPFFAFLVSAYTPPSADSSIELVFNETAIYTPPSADSSIDLVFDLEVQQNVTPQNGSCNYTGGNWVMNCGDYCNISSPVQVGANDILINGTGIVRLTANVYSRGRITIRGVDASNKCTVKCLGGCFSSSYDFCYQESANVSTSCGGLSTGGYYVNVSEWVSPVNLSDGNWSTLSYSDTSSNFFINYTLPANARNGSIWQVKYGGVTSNYTLPNLCMSDNKLQLKILSSAAGENIIGYCYNTTAMQGIFTYGGGVVYQVYEEAMWWNITG